MREVTAVGLCILLVIWAATLHISGYHRLDEAFPQEKMFDLWTGQHFISGILIAAIFYEKKGKVGKPTRQLWLWLWGLAYGWEIIECVVENGGAGAHLQAWIGREIWTNRFCSDPGAVLAGGALYTFRPTWWRWWFTLVATGITVAWIVLNWVAPTVTHIEEQLLLGL